MIISSSLLAADASKYGSEVLEVYNAGSQYLHIDIMDGHFVSNLSFGPNILSGIRKICPIYFDVHLMITTPMLYYQSFIDAGADSITVHYECKQDLREMQECCRKQGKGFGLAINPETKIKDIDAFLPNLDILLIMGIHPGFGGQKLIEETLQKIEEAARERKQNQYSYLISVDGGVNPLNSGRLAAAGTDILVAGSALFGSSDRVQAIQNLQKGKVHEY